MLTKLIVIVILQYVHVKSLCCIPYTYIVCVCVYSVTQLCLTLLSPMDCSPPGSSLHCIFPGKNTGEGCHFLFQGTFLTEGLNLCLWHCRWTLYC